MFREFIFPGYVRLSRASRKASRRTSERGRLIQTGAVVCAAIGIDTGLTLVYQLFAFLVCLIVVSRISLRLQIPRVSVRRRLPRYATAGQPFEYSISVRNESDLVESDLKIIDHPRVIPPDITQFRQEREPGEETRNAWDRWIGFHRFIWLQRQNTGIVIKEGNVPEIPLMSAAETPMQATPLRRGLVEFTSTTLLRPDPFGLNYSVTRYENHEQLMVLPRRYAIHHPIELQGGRNFQPGGVNPTWSIGESDEFVALRDYREGDSLRRIHWASTARRDKPVVREYQDEFFIRQALVLDTGTTDAVLLEECISVAASIALQLETTDGLMDLIYVSDSARVVTSGRGFAEHHHQLEVLATLEASTAPPEKLHDAVLAHRKAMSGCVLVLPAWEDCHRDLYRILVESAVPLQLFIVTRDEDELREVPDHARVLPLGEIADRLAAL